MKRTLGTCYYPEHWSSSLWKEDARRMVEAGLSWVRIGEFAWSRLEPTPRQYQLIGWMKQSRFGPSRSESCPRHTYSDTATLDD